MLIVFCKMTDGSLNIIKAETKEEMTESMRQFFESRGVDTGSAMGVILIYAGVESISMVETSLNADQIDSLVTKGDLSTKTLDTLIESHPEMQQIY